MSTIDDAAKLTAKLRKTHEQDDCDDYANKDDSHVCTELKAAKCIELQEQEIARLQDQLATAREGQQRILKAWADWSSRRRR